MSGKKLEIYAKRMRTISNVDSIRSMEAIFQEVQARCDESKSQSAGKTLVCRQR